MRPEPRPFVKVPELLHFLWNQFGEPLQPHIGRSASEAVPAGWRNGTLDPEVELLYQEALDDISSLGATIVPDPFAGTGFANLSDLNAYDLGFTGAANDFQNYLQNSFDIASFDAFVDIVGANPVTPDGPLSFIIEDVPKGPDGKPDANITPDLGPFRDAQRRYRSIFNQVFEDNNLDAMVFPTNAVLTPPITAESGGNFTTGPEINIMGAPLAH